MAPTSCHYSRLPMDENPKKLGDCKLPVWVGIVGILLGLLVVVLSVVVGILAAKANSPACKDGLRAEQECRNITHFLEQELTQAQDALRGTEAQAATCNQTVETLKISLEEEKAGGRKQQELVQKLQEEIKLLNHLLQNKSSELQDKSQELEQLRQENEALVSAKCPPNSGISLHLSMVPVLLTLSLLALLA
ncbi:bone marrow stromal antigen 2 isoform X4 [Pipistrellus kuhlii]|uniref:bone marrow stromal antigen 2 isoform X4 n=1 Tax=Pipistrellus kuhlii TaxID=59472 RepID=UPI00174EFB3C|nr:bone marrow stromal antigen 2 isoform X4 [Pipistrellus kuhlii]XP_036306169.1 bone marrow stromal antigen 2 isoform X4 [Pipistrellus kuhlii]